MNQSSKLMNFLQKPETKVAVIFLLISSCWIIFSDRLLEKASKLFQFDEARAQTLKGLFFIIVLAFIIYFLIKRYSRQMQASYEEYREMFDSHPTPMWIYNTSLKIVKVNDAAIRKYGYSKAEFLNMSIKQIRPGEDIPRLEKRIESLVPGYRASGIWRHKKKNGEIIHVNITSHDITFHHNKCMLVMADDITNLIKAKEELQASELSLSIIINNTRDLIWSFDNDLKLLACNNAFSNALRSLTGKEPRLGELMNVNDFGELSYSWQHYYNRVLEGEMFSILDSYGTNPQNRIYTEITFNPIINEQGKVTGAVCFSRDITQKQKQEEKIKTQNSALKEIAFSNSHLVRRPLSNILGLIYMLDEKEVTPEMIKEAVENIKISATQLDNIIKDIATRSSQVIENSRV